MTDRPIISPSKQRLERVMLRGLPVSLARQNIKIETLLVQLDFFDALQSRHQQWADDMGDREIVQMHDEISDLILQIQNKCVRLLKLYGTLDH